MVACAERFSVLATHAIGMFLFKGVQIREVGEAAKVEQLLLNGHKNPAWTQMLK